MKLKVKGLKKGNVFKKRHEVYFDTDPMVPPMWRTASHLASWLSACEKTLLLDKDGHHGEPGRFLLVNKTEWARKLAGEPGQVTAIRTDNDLAEAIRRNANPVQNAHHQTLRDVNYAVAWFYEDLIAGLYGSILNQELAAKLESAQVLLSVFNGENCVVQP